MAKKKKGQRAAGLIEIARKMPDGKTRHFYGHSRAECEDKSRHSDCIINPHGCSFFEYSCGFSFTLQFPQISVNTRNRPRFGD